MRDEDLATLYHRMNGCQQAALKEVLGGWEPVAPRDHNCHCAAQTTTTTPAPCNKQKRCLYTMCPAARQKVRDRADRTREGQVPLMRLPQTFTYANYVQKGQVSFKVTTGSYMLDTQADLHVEMNRCRWADLTEGPNAGAMGIKSDLVDVLADFRPCTTDTDCQSGSWNSLVR